MKRRLLEIQAEKKALMEETSKIALRNRYRIEQLYKHCGCPYRKKAHGPDFSVFQPSNHSLYSYPSLLCRGARVAEQLRIDA